MYLIGSQYNIRIFRIMNSLFIMHYGLEDYKQEEAYYTDGKLEALISEKLFYQVQQIMDKKRKVEGPGGRVLGNDRFPLRGLLTCPNCGKNLTASGAKGKSKTYYYYHCH